MSLLNVIDKYMVFHVVLRIMDTYGLRHGTLRNVLGSFFVNWFPVFSYETGRFCVDIQNSFV